MTVQRDWPAVSQAIIKGVEKALRNYEKMSHRTNWRAIPESYFQSKIADELSATKGLGAITLEEPYGEILGGTDAGKKGAGYLTKRADIVIWGSNGKARMIVEIKRVYQKGSGLARDAEKIRRVLRVQPKLRGILVGLYRYRNSKKEIEDKVNEFADGVITVKRAHKNWKYGQVEGKKQYAGAGIFLVR